MAEALALVDLGSNATRVLLARISPGVELRILREERIQTRLAGGPRGRLSADAVDETVAAVASFLRRARQIPEARVLAIATAAVRDAPNSALLIGRLREQEGLDVRVLAPDEEARLGALAASWSLPLARALVFDLGGGSLQLAYLDDGEIHSLGSYPLGAVSATQRFLRRDPPGPEEIGALRRAAWRSLKPVLDRVEPAPLVGLGGTVRTLARIHRERGSMGHPPIHGLRLPRAEVERIREALELLPSARRSQPGLKPERADIILAGSILVEELLGVTGADALTVCARSVRHGFLIQETLRGVAMRGPALSSMAS